MKRVIKIVFVLAIVVLPVLPAHSATPELAAEKSASAVTCPEIVQTAWENVDQICTAAGRNEACYGHALLNAEAQPGVENFVFDEAGNIVKVSELRSLRLSTMDLLNGYWGVALLRIQANLPANAVDKNISLLLFGDVQIENTGNEMPAIGITSATATHPVNVRYSPSTRAVIIGNIAPGEVLTATGRWTNSWVRVEMPDRATPGWVYAPLISAVEGSIEDLAEVEISSTYYGPMQAFYFQSGQNDAACPEAPNSGILIQTPEGVAEVTLLINEVDIQLGSTVYFQAEDDNEMTVSVVEGHATVSANGVTHTARAGSQISVPMANGIASGPPSEPHPYNMDSLAALPVTHAGRPVVIAEPLTEEEIAIILATEEAAAAATDDEGESEEVSEEVSNPSTGDTPPGLDGVVPPGQTDDPVESNPGHGGTPPGQAKKE